LRQPLVEHRHCATVATVAKMVLLSKMYYLPLKRHLIGLNLADLTKEVLDRCPGKAELLLLAARHGLDTGLAPQVSAQGTDAGRLLEEGSTDAATDGHALANELREEEEEELREEEEEEELREGIHMECLAEIKDTVPEVLDLAAMNAAIDAEIAQEEQDVVLGRLMGRFGESRTDAAAITNVPRKQIIAEPPRVAPRKTGQASHERLMAARRTLSRTRTSDPGPPPLSISAALTQDLEKVSLSWSRE